MNRPLVQTIGARASKRFAVVFTLSPFPFLCSGMISLEHPVESGYLAPAEPAVREVASTSLKILPSDRGGFWRLASTLDVHANVTHVLCKCPYNIYTAVFMHISRVHTRTPLLNIQASVQISNGRLKIDISLDRSLMSPFTRPDGTPTFLRQCLLLHAKASSSS